MAFYNGFKSVSGLCGVSMFHSFVSWSDYGGNPIPAGNLYASGYTGDLATRGDLGGVRFDISGHASWADIYVIDISYAPLKQVVLKGRYRLEYRDIVYGLYVREYDAQGETYTDTQFGNSTNDLQLFNHQSGWAAYRTSETYGVFTIIMFNGTRYLIAGVSEDIEIDDVGTRSAWKCFMYPWDDFENSVGPVPTYEDFSPEFGPGAKPKGGYNEKSQKKGTFDDHSYQIVPTTKPNEGISTCGFINVYECNRQALKNLGGQLFPAPVSFDLYEVIRNRYDMDYVIGCKLVPMRTGADYPMGGAPINVGYHRFDVSADGGRAGYVGSDYVDKELGSVGCLEYWGNFLDYAGTTAQLFLPFLGFVPIEPEFWNGGGRIHLQFRMNCVTGDFIYFIRSTSEMSELDDSLVAQYGGNCAVDIPVTGVQAGNALIKAYSGALTAGLGLFVGDAGGVANGVQQMCGLRPDVPKSGGIGGAAGFFGHRRPFLLIKRQDSQFSEKFPDEVGLPLYAQMRLGDCHGLTIAKDAHLDTIPADVEVKEKINQLLNEGVIL